MSIELTEATLGLWYVQMHMKDWMCGVTRLDERRFEFKYRFRYYKEPHDPWDGQDRKSWYEGTVDAERDTVVRRMALMAHQVLKISGDSGQVYACVRGLDEPFERYTERFMKLPFVHAKTVSEQEYKDKYGK